MPSSEALGTPLEEEELTAAMKILDTDESGVIEFYEFVDWWVNKVVNLLPLSLEADRLLFTGQARAR